MMASEASNVSYPEIGVTEPHHLCRITATSPRRSPSTRKSTSITCSCSRNFVDKLRATADGDGSLLDHSLIFYGSGMGNGNAHDGYPLPLVAVGVAPTRAIGTSSWR